MQNQKINLSLGEVIMNNVLVNSIIKKHGVSTLATLASYCFNKSITVFLEKSTVILLTESGANIIDDHNRRIALGKFYRMQTEHRYGFLFKN